MSVLARCMRYSQLCLKSQLVEYCMRLRLECGYRVSACIRIRVRPSVRIRVRLWISGLGFSSDIRLRQDPQLQVSHLATSMSVRVMHCALTLVLAAILWTDL